jgi:hypothetical protein
LKRRAEDSHASADESLGIDLHIRDRANPNTRRHDDHGRYNLGGVVLAVEHPFHQANHRDHAQFRDLIETDGVEHETKVHPGDGRVGDEGEPDELPERDVLGYGVAGGVGDPSDERRDREVESGQRRGCIRPKEETKKRRKNQIPRRRHQEQTRTCGSRSAERGKGRRRSARRREGYRRRRRSRRRT